MNTHTHTSITQGQKKPFPSPKTHTHIYINLYIHTYTHIIYFPSIPFKSQLQTSSHSSLNTLMCIFRNKGITFNYVIVTFRLSKIKEINTFIMLIINSLYSNLASFPSNIHNYYYFPSLVFNPESHIVFSFHSSSTSSHSLASLFFMIFLKSSVQLFHRKSSI